MDIGKKIRALRLDKNITQEKLASHLNLSYQAISKWENNDSQPDISLLVPLANYFDVSVDYLLGNQCSFEFYQTRREKLQNIYEIDRSDQSFRDADVAYKTFIEKGQATAKDYWYYAYLYDVRASESISIAKKLYHKAIACCPQGQEGDISNAYEELVRLLIDSNQKLEALDLLEKWLEEDDSNVFPYIQLANYYNMINKPKKAFDYIRKAETLDNVNAQLFLIKGEVMASLDMNEQAIMAWHTSFELNSDIARALYNKAGLYEALKLREKAIATYEEIIDWHNKRQLDSIDAEYPKRKIEALKSKEL